MAKRRRRRVDIDQGHSCADLNALAAVKDVFQMLRGSDEPRETLRKRAIEILRDLCKERKMNLDRAFIYEDALRILISK